MCDFFNQLVWLVSARNFPKITSLKSKKYTKLKYLKCKAKATIGMVDGIQKAIFKPDPQIKADLPRLFEKEARA